jgi:hypothetical protein
MALRTIVQIVPDILLDRFTAGAELGLALAEFFVDPAIDIRSLQHVICDPVFDLRSDFVLQPDAEHVPGRDQLAPIRSHLLMGATRLAANFP